MQLILVFISSFMLSLCLHRSGMLIERNGKINWPWLLSGALFAGLLCAASGV